MKICSLFTGYGGDTRGPCGNGVVPQQAVAALRHMLGVS